MRVSASIRTTKCGVMKSFYNIVNHQGKYMQSKTIAFLKRRLSFNVRDDKKMFQKISLLLLVKVVHKVKLHRRKGKSNSGGHFSALQNPCCQHRELRLVKIICTFPCFRLKRFSLSLEYWIIMTPFIQQLHWYTVQKKKRSAIRILCSESVIINGIYRGIRV
jgi:hypothetical protein